MSLLRIILQQRGAAVHGSDHTPDLVISTARSSLALRNMFKMEVNIGMTCIARHIFKILLV